MRAASIVSQPPVIAPYSGIVRGGLTAGILDISAACLTYWLRGGKPIRILQSVAGGLLGADTYDGGAATAMLGLACHFLIAFSAATVFGLAARRIPSLTRHAVPAGILYGIAVYIFMHLGVVPLSAFPHKLTFPPLVLTVGVLTHILCVGLPISLANREARDRESSRDGGPHMPDFSQ